MDTQKLTNSSNALAGSVQLVKERNRSSNKVKLCGYLKKKRNKVGGWRKMWFVLQDKLLLSYASKEEYDNKLVSFKDVLNLVPGTMVRPLGGFRFTIETTTHVMYTFHCDDRNAYREWITMLLDSLTAASSSKIISANSSAASAYALLPIQQQRFRNTSVDNIPYALWSTAGQNSQRQRELSSSCDSMRQRVELLDANGGEYAYLERMANVKARIGLKSTTRSPLAPALSLPSQSNAGGAGVGGGGIGVAVRLPIARSTAKLLERNGVNSSDPLKKYQQQHQQQHYQKRQQVNCCNRSSGTTASAISSKNYNNNNANENVTDARLTTEASATHFRLHGESNCSDFTTLDNGRHSSSAGSTSSSTSASACHGPVNQTVLKINSMFQRQSNSPTAPESVGATNRQHVVNKEFPNYPKSTQTNCDQNETIPKYKHNNKRNNNTNECKNNNNQLLLADSCLMSDDAEVAVDNISAAYSSISRDSQAMVMVKDQIQRMHIKGRKETLSYANVDAAVERHEQRRVVLTKKLEEESFIETKASMTKTLADDEACEKPVLDSDVESVDGDAEEQQQLIVEKATSATCNRSSEPIYAVVDLAHKYAQRQQRNVQNNLKSLEANRCRSYESIIQGVDSSVVLTNGCGALGKSNINLHEDDIDGIYEDGDNFSPNCENVVLTNGDEDENIYEPVGFDNFGSQKIPASASQPNAFWRYITRLKVNSLLQFTRMRRHHHNHTDYDTIDLSTPSSSPTPTASNRRTKTTLAKKQAAGTTIPTTNTTTSSQFASIKRKFGAHRKSMQVRVRKICARNYEPKTTTFGNKLTAQQQQNGDGHLAAGVGMSNGVNIASSVGGAGKKSKYRWKSVKIRPKQFNGAYNGTNGNNCGTSCTTDDISCKTTRRQSFFGSLPHLRKARVSLFSTPNLHLTAAKDQNSNVSSVSDVYDKALVDKIPTEGKREYEELNELSS
uniref:PH domain-containing protein n=1 Tax=Zeugodacus cucurbitae TaxID=28588 RepID=A0A0A1XBZ4_ZEUCU